MIPITGVSLIEQFRSYFQCTAEELSERVRNRMPALHSEWHTFFDGKEVNETTLADFYTRSEILKYAYLHTGLSQIQFGITAMKDIAERYPFQTMLDIGCGFGILSGIFCDEVDVWLADFPNTHLAFLPILWEKAHTVSLLDIQQIPATFDVVYCSEVLEHTLHPVQFFLEQVAGRLKENGTAIVAYSFIGYESNHTHLKDGMKYMSEGRDSFLDELAAVGWRMVYTPNNTLKVFKHGSSNRERTV